MLCGQRATRRRGTRERQVGSTLAAEAQAISATCAASRSPARAVASKGEGRGARPRATDGQLVGGGQGVCVLPESKGGHGVRGRGVMAVQAACMGRARLKAGGGQGTRGAHPEHAAHGRDLGRVEAERLV